MSPGDHLHIKYPLLFSVKVLHHYFLDEGETLFDLLPTATDRARKIAKYQTHKIWDIQPTPQTEQLLKGRSLIFKKNALGFVIMAANNGSTSEAQLLGENDSLLFVMKVIDPYFFQYSAGFSAIEKVAIEKSLDPDEPDRYFKNVYKLSNFTAASYPFLAQTPNLYDLAQAYAPEAMVKHLAADGFFMAKQLVANSSAPQNASDVNWLKLDSLNAPRHYVSAADFVEALELNEDLPADTFALIEIKGGNVLGDFSLYDAGGKMRSPEYEIRFKNRLTWWTHSLPQHFGGPLTTIVQKDALPLTAQGKSLLTLTFKVDSSPPGTTIDLKKDGVENPDAFTPIRYEKQANKVQRLWSDIYVQ